MSWTESTAAVNDALSELAAALAPDSPEVERAGDRLRAELKALRQQLEAERDRREQAECALAVQTGLRQAAEVALESAKKQLSLHQTKEQLSLHQTLSAVHQTLSCTRLCKAPEEAGSAECRNLDWNSPAQTDPIQRSHTNAPTPFQTAIVPGGAALEHSALELVDKGSEEREQNGVRRWRNGQKGARRRGKPQLAKHEVADFSHDDTAENQQIATREAWKAAAKADLAGEEAAEATTDVAAVSNDVLEGALEVAQEGEERTIDMRMWVRWWFHAAVEATAPKKKSKKRSGGSWVVS